MLKVHIRPHWEISFSSEPPIDTAALLGLLLAIHDAGSIAQAAKAVGLSYRYAWGLLRDAERLFGEQLLETGRGRGTGLTPLAQKLVWADRRIAARLSPTLESLASELEAELSRVRTGTLRAVRIDASHGFAVAALTGYLNRIELPIELRYRSCSDALAALARRECDLAGFHTPVGRFEQATVAHYMRWLDPAQHCLVHIALREQGLIVARGNPFGIAALADLGRPGVRFVNRQVGSGTRMLLEMMLAHDGIAPDGIGGYNSAEFTHSAVAAYIASGMADVGIGVRAAAARFNLDFVPLAKERYFFALRTDALDEPLMRQLAAVLRQRAYHELVDALPGYDAAGTGRIESLAEAFGRGGAPRSGEPVSINTASFNRISDVPRAVAARTPHAPALLEAGRVLSYAQLVDEIDRHALLLRELGVRAGDRVMIVGENSIAQVALVFAAASIDAWAVNVNARLTGRELEDIRLHSGARRVVYTAQASLDAAAHARREGAQPHGGLMIGPLNCACAAEPAEPGAQQVAALVYTTGTTGQPKGVMLTHANLLFVASVSSRLRGLVPSDRAYGVLPVSHVYGLSSVMLGTLCAGASLLLEPRFSAAAMLAAIRDDGLTIVQGVPAMYARLLELSRGAPLPSKLRFCYAGGSPLDPVLKRDVERMLGLPLHNGYGLTESGPTVSQTRLDAPRADSSVGCAIPGVEVRIAGAAPGQPGRLLVRGPNVMRGYYRAPQATREAIDAEGWLDTGDIARMDPDGALFIVGRAKELIIRSGFNVYPLEVETVLNAHPAVRQSAVVGRELAAGDEEVVAFVEAATDAGVDAQQLQAWAAGRLAPYKRPAEIVVMAALPAAPSGKVLKAQLKALANDAQAPGGAASSGCSRAR